MLVGDDMLLITKYIFAISRTLCMRINHHGPDTIIMHGQGFC